MIILNKRIKIESTPKEFTIVPIGDIHFNSLSFEQEAWESFLEKIKHFKNPLFILLGDITDPDRPTTRDRRKQIYFDRPEAQIQSDKLFFDELIKSIAPKLSFLNSSNCLGIMDGDHYRVFPNGVTSTEVLCKYLDVPYLGSGQAIVRIIFKLRNKSKIFVLHARHGRGYHSTAGGKINANRKFVDFWEGIDLFVKGHSHSSWEDEIVRNVFTREGFLYEKKIESINAGSFKKTFITQKDLEEYKKNFNFKKLSKEEKQNRLLEFAGLKLKIDYAEKREYPPVNKSLIVVKLKIMETRKIKGYPDLHLEKSVEKIDI